MVEDPEGATMAAARGLHDLALDFAARSHAAQAALVRAFEAEAAAWAGQIGELLVNETDDEHLVLTSGGRFAGRVSNDDAAAGWQTLDSPDDVAENYDPVDLFSDVADAVAEAFLDRDEDEPPEEPMPVTAAASVPLPWEPPADPGGEEESATMRNLRKLREAGVLSQAEFEARKAELHR